MEKNNFEVRATQHITRQDFVKVERELEGEDLGRYGFLHGISDELLLIQVDIDFQMDGYAVIPLFTVSNIRCNKTDKFHKSVLKKEGTFQRDYGIDFPLDLTNWQTVFRTLKALNLIVSTEDEEAEETDFVIGRIARVNRKSVSIQYFDALGQLESSITNVKYSDITILCFDNRYIRTYAKYLKEPKKKNV